MLTFNILTHKHYEHKSCPDSEVHYLSLRRKPLPLSNGLQLIIHLVKDDYVVSTSPSPLEINLNHYVPSYHHHMYQDNEFLIMPVYAHLQLTVFSHLQHRLHYHRQSSKSICNHIYITRLIEHIHIIVFKYF